MNVDSFENLAARIVASITKLSPNQFTSLIITSPLCTRTPDICILWHAGYRKDHRIGILFKQLFIVGMGFLKGFISLITNIRSYEYALFGEIKNTILVVASTSGYVTSNNEYKTDYVYTEKSDSVFAFGPMGSCGKNAVESASLSLRYKVFLVYMLIKNGTVAFFEIKGDLFEKIILLLEWFEWAVSLKWLYFYNLEVALTKVVKNYNIKKVGCVHEMHPYARVAWRVASKYKAVSCTIQHAAITTGKRWYFSYKEELESGLILPDVLYAYNSRVVKVLKPYFRNTRFVLGCSCRYAHWKDIHTNEEKRGRYYLFVGALASFDNNVLIASLRKLLKESDKSTPIRLRLHPAAQICRKGRYWIKSKVKQGVIEISNGTSLKDDIKDAIVVIGMSTTVLEESLLLHCPVVQLTHPDYLQFIDIDGIPGVMKIDYRELSTGILLSISNVQVDSSEARERLGLNQSLVTYKRLFE
ncbi:MAG: hypothetical protein GY777_07820 [Candidatus Brocadiaceae bacterium]|nr:hypothetical protein [Candidatus Brocadiaceae bacterium]